MSPRNGNPAVSKRKQKWNMSVHVPAVGDVQGLAGQGVGGEGGKEDSHLCDVGGGGVLPGHRVFQLDFLDDALFGEAGLAGPLGELLPDQRRGAKTRGYRFWPR